MKKTRKIIKLPTRKETTSVETKSSVEIKKRVEEDKNMIDEDMNIIKELMKDKRRIKKYEKINKGT